MTKKEARDDLAIGERGYKIPGQKPRVATAPIFDDKTCE